MINADKLFVHFKFYYTYMCQINVVKNEEKKNQIIKQHLIQKSIETKLKRKRSSLLSFNNQRFKTCSVRTSPLASVFKEISTFRKQLLKTPFERQT